MLIGPSGARTILLSDAGGECGPSAVNVTITFDDEAASGYPCGSNPSGTFKPTDWGDAACFEGANDFPPPAPSPPHPVTLSAFDGSDANGEWQLYVFDDISADASGSIANGWSLTITAAIPPAATPTTCKGKLATIVGTSGPDVRRGTPRTDVMVGLGGNDKLSGLAGNDVICGGAGKDTLDGGKGNDTLFGEAGKDTLKGGPGKDKLKGGAGKDKQVQ